MKVEDKKEHVEMLDQQDRSRWMMAIALLIIGQIALMNGLYWENERNFLIIGTAWTVIGLLLMGLFVKRMSRWCLAILGIIDIIVAIWMLLVLYQPRVG